MLFQIHDAPGRNGSPAGASKHKNESHPTDGPYLIIGGEWLSVGEVVEFAKELARFSDAGFAKVSAVVGTTVARRVERLLVDTAQLRGVNDSLEESLERVGSERDELAAKYADAVREIERLREEVAVLRPLNDLVEAMVTEPAKPSRAKAAA